MEHQEIVEMAEKLQAARDDEYIQKKKLDNISQRVNLEILHVLKDAYEQGNIDPKLKVAQLKMEEDLIIAHSAEIALLKDQEQIQEDFFMATKHYRQYHEDLLSLTRAWLYSQSGVGK